MRLGPLWICLATAGRDETLNLFFCTMRLIVDWTLFGPALALLLLPIGLFHGRHTRFRSLSRDWSGQWSLFFKQPHHFADLLRAAAGGWLLAHSLRTAPGASAYMLLMVQVAVVVLGTTLQSIVCSEPDSALAPFAYVLGLAAGFLPPIVAAPALIITAVVTLGTRIPAVAFSALAVSIGVFGAVFIGGKKAIVVAPLVAAPLVAPLIALLFARELGTTHRARSHSGRNYSPLR